MSQTLSADYPQSASKAGYYFSVGLTVNVPVNVFSSSVKVVHWHPSLQGHGIKAGLMEGLAFDIDVSRFIKIVLKSGHFLEPCKLTHEQCLLSTYQRPPQHVLVVKSAAPADVF